MREYEIFTFEEDINQSVVFLNTTEDLYFLQDEIIKNINTNNNKTRTILVDLFLRNGFTFNRYVLLKLDKYNSLKSFIINPREVSEKIKMRINEYLKSNNKLLYASSLNKKEIEFIMGK